MVGQERLEGKVPLRPAFSASVRYCRLGNVPGWSHEGGKAGPDNTLLAKCMNLT